MGEKKLREMMTYQELKEEIIDWSWDTVKRRVKNEGFPAVKEGAGYVFPRSKVILWFKKREVNP